MADVRELGRKVKAKYPGRYDDLDDADLGRKVKAKYPGAYDDFTDAPAQQPEGALSSFQTGLAGPLLRNVVETAADFYNAPGETLERVGRGALEFAAAFDPAGNAYKPTVRDQAARLAELNKRADERLPEPIQSMKRGLAIEEAKPRTTGGRIAGAVGSVLGEVAFPTAPETVAGNIATVPFGGAAAKTVAKAIAPILRRIRGRNVPVTVAEPPPTGIAAEIRAMGPVEQASIRAESALPAIEASPVRPEAAIQAPAPRMTRASIEESAPFKKWFQDGKVVDPEGNPVVVYRGANRDISEAGYKTGPVIRFTSDPDYAASYGNRVFSGYVNLKNPLVVKSTEGFAARAKFYDLSKEDVADLIKRGYDGIIVEPKGNPKFAGPFEEVIAFNQNQFRSVTDFVGMRGPAGSAQSLPTRPNLADGPPPLLEVADDAPFEVSLGKERAPTPGRVGPRFDEAVELALRGGAPIARAAERSPWQDTTLAYFRGNLLTNPAGRATDLGSTLINQFADAATRPVAAAVDIAVSKLTGVRSISGLSARGTGRALGSIKQGLKDAGQVLKTGKQAIDSGADDAVYSSEIRSGLGKAVDLPINGVFRVLGALDAPFRRYGFARNLYDRARVAASNEARRGAIPRDQLLARTRQLLDDPGIISAAVRDGEASVLSQPNKISSGLAKLTANSPNARLAIGLVQPFMRIPLNAVLKAADFSGIGGVKALYKIARGVGRKARGKSFFKDIEEQRVFSQNVAAGSFGPAAFLLGMELEDQGKLEGYYYTSKRDYPNGKVPTSINIRGENYDINRLGGFIAAPLFIGATYNRLRKQDSSRADAFLRSFSGLIQTAPALGYYGVPAKVGRLLTSDEPVGELQKEAGGIVSGFIPASGALGATAKAIDPEKRREAEGFTGPIMNRIPVLRERLPVKKNRKNAARR